MNVRYINAAEVNISISNVQYHIDKRFGLNSEYALSDANVGIPGPYYAYGGVDTDDFRAAVDAMFLQNTTLVIRMNLDMKRFDEDMLPDSEFLQMTKETVQWARERSEQGRPTVVRLVVQDMPEWLADISLFCDVSPVTCLPYDAQKYNLMIGSALDYVSDQHRNDVYIDSIELMNEPYIKYFYLVNLPHDDLRRYDYLWGWYANMEQFMRQKYPQYTIIAPPVTDWFKNAEKTWVGNFTAAALSAHMYSCGSATDAFPFCDQYVRYSAAEVSKTCVDIRGDIGMCEQVLVDEFGIDSKVVKEDTKRYVMQLNSMFHGFFSTDLVKEMDFYYLPMQSETDPWGYVQDRKLHGGIYLMNPQTQVIREWTQYHAIGDVVQTIVSGVIATATIDGNKGYLTITNQQWYPQTVRIRITDGWSGPRMTLLGPYQTRTVRLDAPVYDILLPEELPGPSQERVLFVCIGCEYNISVSRMLTVQIGTRR